MRTCGFKSHLPHFLGIKRVYQKALKPSKINGFGAFSCLNLSQKKPSFLPHSAPFLPHRFFIISLLNLKLNQKGKRIAPLKASQTNMTVHDTVVFELPLLKIVFMSVTFSINSGGNIQLFIIEDKYRPVENSTLLISNSAIGATAYTDGKIAYDSDGHGLALGIGTYTMIGMYRYFV